MDFFLANRVLQPKLEVANYVASQGVPVPRRYASFAEALHGGTPFIMRSEHPQDYAGVAGLLDSFRISDETLSRARAYDASQITPNSRDHLLEGLKNKLAGGSDHELAMAAVQSGHDSIQSYCTYLGLREDDFLSETSYSYWSLLSGLNRTIVADSAIRDRYHIFTSATPNPDTGHNYTIVDGGRIVMSWGWGLDIDAVHASLTLAIDHYESIRRLSRFDANHCPIIECQFVEGLHYFLQYHRCRDFEPASFELSRASEEGEIEAIFVRGATPPEGVVVDTVLFYPHERTLEAHEDASFDWHTNRVFSEIMSRRRTAYFTVMSNRYEIASRTSLPHLLKSRLFKPQVSLAVPFGNSLDSIVVKAHMMTDQQNAPFRLPIQVTSDGRRALVKIIDRVGQE